MSTKKSASKKVSKKKSSKIKTEKKTMKIGDFTRQLLLEGGRTSDEIIKEAKKKFPKSAVSPKHISWYCWDLKRKEIKFPKLPKS